MPATTPRRDLGAALALLTLAGLLSGCGDGGGPAPFSTSARPTPPRAYTVVTAPTLRPGDPLPPLTQDPVVTITGRLAQGEEVALDIPTIERLGLVEYSIDDRQAEGRRVMARGVLLRSLLDYVGAGDARTLHTVALNDYSVDLPVSDARELPVVLATSIDGHRLTVEHYGPTRVVYPTDGVDLDPAVYDPRWIWQLKAIEVG